MSQSLLFFGGTKSSREQALFKDIDNKKSPDVKVVEPEKEKKSIGIEQVRESVKFLQEKPFELKYKYLVIPQAEKLTREAQNALLKVLEEPPIYGDIRLGTKAEQDLLETVISRCKKINVDNIKTTRVGDRGEKETENTETEYTNYKAVKKMTLGERLDFMETLSKEEKEVILETLEEWINQERGFMATTNNTTAIYSLIRVLEDLNNTNINTKLSLEYLAINL